MGVSIDKIAEAYDVEVGNGMPSKGKADMPKPRYHYQSPRPYRHGLLVRTRSAVPARQRLRGYRHNAGETVEPHQYQQYDTASAVTQPKDA